MRLTPITGDCMNRTLASTEGTTGTLISDDRIRNQVLTCSTWAALIHDVGKVFISEVSQR